MIGVPVLDASLLLGTLLRFVTLCVLAGDDGRHDIERGTCLV